ncbi:MAG TPA: hypothetical protein VM841_12340 [Actinomycetota bacterium]|nr:hypothetical protein [Actinomycetota bacterium]
MTTVSLPPSVHADLTSFCAALRPPAAGGPVRVYCGHQIQADYPASVVAKLAALAGLAEAGPVALWLDTDRAGSQRAMTTITLPDGTRIPWVPHRVRDAESRFIPLGIDRVAGIADALREWARVQAPGARSRLDALVAAAASAPQTLSSALRAWSMHLVRAGLGLAAGDVMVSDLLDRPAVRARVQDLVDSIEDVVAVFNETVESLVAGGLDPAVRPVAPDYLPLHYSCPVDGSRRRLSRRGRDAEAECGCGAVYRFSLGDLDALFATRRWSTDVTLPLAIEPLYSGVVAGKTSWRYGLVLGAVGRRVWQSEPLPSFLPPALTGDGDAAGETTLLLRYLGDR